MAESESQQRNAFTVLDSIRLSLGARTGKAAETIRRHRQTDPHRHTTRPQNPLIPPSHDPSKPLPSPQHAVIPDAEREDEQQAATSFFALRQNLKDPQQRVLTMLVPVLALILMIVLVKTSSGPPASPNEIAPQQPAASDARLATGVDTPKPDTPKPETPKPVEAAPVSPAEVEQAKPNIENENAIQAANLINAQPVQVAKAIPEPKLGPGPKLRPKPKLGPGPKGLIVEGILYSKDNPAAIVDNELVHVGDTIQGATVMEITENGVIFKKAGKSWDQNVQPK